MSDCQICCYSSKKLFECARCNHKVCRTCCRRLTESLDPACVVCGARWGTRECKERLGSTYHRTDFRKRKRKLYLSREMAMLPQTAPYAERERQKRFLKGEIKRILVEVRQHFRWDLLPDLRVAQASLRTVMSQHQPTNRLWNVVYCPRYGCSGVALNGVCNLCSGEVCPRCGRERHEGEECRGEDLLSMNLIRSTTRSCPGCTVPTTRTEGCPIMWCSQCHIFWHWDHRSIIETRGQTVPHNPDHRAWLATRPHGRGREMQDLPCGGFPDLEVVHQSILREVSLKNFQHLSVKSVPELLSSIEAVLFAQNNVRPRYPRERRDDALLKLRVGFLLGDFNTRDEFANAIEFYERTMEMKAEISDVLETFVHSSLDVFQRLAAGVDGINTTLVRMMSLRTLVNDALQSCSAVWERKAPRLTDDWIWRLPYSRQRQ